ncbi:MAG: hypothetical protein AAGJ91_07550 [Pseudomonadota bacterium]
MLDDDDIHVADIKEQKKALKNLEKGLRQALLAYQALHPDVRRSLEHEASDTRAKNPSAYCAVFFTSTDGKSEPIQTYSEVELFVRNALAGLIGASADDPSLASTLASQKGSALAAGLAALEQHSMTALTPHARDGESWRKAKVVREARDLWKRLKGVEAPKAASGDFGDFLSELILALGKDWDPASTMNAWKNRADSEGWIF